jgi:hypothetical protein
MPLLFSSAASICSSVATFGMGYFNAEFLSAFSGCLPIYGSHPL